jgi:SNF2 family DNA or RNA helicase
LTFYHDTTRNLLLYPVSPAALRVQHYIPEARPINGSLLAVPRTLRTSQVLRWLGLPVAPVVTDTTFDWPRPPHIDHPYETQKLAANFMVLHPRCFNLSDMGVGKTMSAIWAAEFLMRAAPGTRALVVCPLSIMERVWADAIFKTFLSSRKIEILHGSAEKRIAALARPADWYIVNHDGVTVGAHTRKRLELDGFSKALAEREDIRICVVDEASAYRDSQTRRWKVAQRVIGDRPYLWMMTGTPTPNAPTDAYGLAKMVNGAQGLSFGAFRDNTMIKITNFKWKPQRDGYEKARRLLTPSIRFDIKDVWDGPELTVQQREVPLTAQQKALMHALKQDLQIVLKSGEPISATNEAAARTKFLQISLGAVYDAAHSWHAVDAEPRLAELRAVIEEAPGKILVFIPLTSVIDMISKKLTNVSHAVVNGNVSQKDRSRIFSAFQCEPEPRVLLADPGTMAHGLDLWAARTVVWYGCVDRTELYLQANKRAHRPGQKFPVTVVQIVSNPLEREIYRRLGANESLQGALLDAVRRGEL